MSNLSNSSLFRKFFVETLYVVAALAGIVGVIIALMIWHDGSPPPPPPTPSATLTPTPTLDPRTAVMGLMDQEVSAAEHRNITLVNQIYAPNAIVTDEACQPGDQYQTWNGREQIDERYRGLPRFLSLAHNTPQVTLIPNDSLATQAIATASTQGQFVMDGTQKRVSLSGNERWEFSKIGGQWYITAFTYSLC